MTGEQGRALRPGDRVRWTGQPAEIPTDGEVVTAERNLVVVRWADGSLSHVHPFDMGLYQRF